MKSDSKYKKERKDKIEELSSIFGSPRKDEIKLVNGSSLHYKENSYQVENPRKLTP